MKAKVRLKRRYGAFVNFFSSKPPSMNAISLLAKSAFSSAVLNFDATNISAVKRGLGDLLRAILLPLKRRRGAAPGALCECYAQPSPCKAALSDHTWRFETAGLGAP